MRYRLELDGEFLSVRNVDADCVVGRVLPFTKPNPENPDLPILEACSVYNNEGHEVGFIKVKHGLNSLKDAIFVVASDERDRGFPSLKQIDDRRPDSLRVEFQLGEVVADTVTTMSGALTEYQNGGLKPESLGKFGQFIVQLHDIWYASRFGSFNGESFADEPYFRNTDPQGPRLGFGEAAKHWAMHDLQCRFPGVSEAMLQELVVSLLEFLKSLVDLVAPVTFDPAAFEMQAS